MTKGSERCYSFSLQTDFFDHLVGFHTSVWMRMLLMRKAQMYEEIITALSAKNTKPAYRHGQQYNADKRVLFFSLKWGVTEEALFTVSR
jgi:hypothetical protein